MSKIKLTGDTSGYVEISAPNVAANNTLELGGGTKILTNLDNVFTGVTTYSGNIDLNANLDLGDDNIVRLGTGNDLQIYHDGSNSYLSNSTGDLIIRDDSRVRIRTDQLVVNSGDNTESLIYAEKNGGVFLYHNASQKFETTTTGATVTGTLVSDGVTSELDLTAISSSISDTATDIFVYDTRKDSDGGAWRKRTQHTSWYNETLNTSTRGSRKEFPAVAVIVAERNFIKIYDGDDPDLPMWMVFNTIANGVSQGMAGRPMVQVQNTDKIVYALNGILATGTRNEGSNYGQPVINFISEKVLRMDSEGGEGGEWMGTIAQRNEAIGYRSVSYDYVIAASRVNDIAMTVLPNAPIDDATGLPVPTIAVATDAGISVITDSGSVYDLTTSDVYDNYAKVEFGDNNRLYYTASGTQVLYSRAIPSADQNYTAYNTQNTNRVMFPTMDHGGFTSGHPVKLLGTNGSTPLLIVKNKASGCNETSYSPLGIDPRPGLSFIDEGETNPTSMVAYATTSYNTGWMLGDIKGAFLSDTDTTNITSGEILSNGDFTNGTTGWTIQDAGEGSISSSSNQLTLNNSTSADPPVACYQQISLEVGKYYNVESNRASGLDVVVNITTGTSNGGGTGAYGNVIIHTSNGDKSATFLATHATMYCYIRVNTNATGTAVMNSVSIRKAEEDRSHNTTFSRDKVSALTINGTVTKSAVATGAELVAYSGFTDNDYLTQPYNSDLDFGTGDYYMSIWAKGGGNAQCLMIREHGVSSGNGLDADGSILLFQHSGKYAFYSRENGTGSWTNFLASNATYGNYWSHLVMVRSGGTLYGYVNGKLEGSSSFAGDVSNNDAEIYIGRRNPSVDNSQEYSGSLALARIGGSAPSPEQIKKMYEDEKVLFQENAKCTLYGSSDAVTALAYDEDTELLHVGTSAGRSDFQGLRRINNTTTAVTTAISASDELIAEQ